MSLLFGLMDLVGAGGGTRRLRAPHVGEAPPAREQALDARLDEVSRASDWRAPPAPSGSRWRVDSAPGLRSARRAGTGRAARARTMRDARPRPRSSRLPCEGVEDLPRHRRTRATACGSDSPRLVEHGLEASVRELATVDTARRCRSRLFGLMITSGLRNGRWSWRRSAWKSWAGVVQVADLHVAVGAELEEALEAGARVLGPLPFVAVGQQQREPRHAPPLRLGAAR